jgi:putative Mn2+ efflux pump MntP
MLEKMPLLAGSEMMRLTCPGDGWVFFFAHFAENCEEERTMSGLELFVIAVGLSMDAFAVSVCKGLSVGKLHIRHSLVCGMYFGAFQALMPLLGWVLGVQFQSLITTVDHWIAFVLLGLIGFNMVRESREEGECIDASFSSRAMLPLAVATSIDALAVGVTFAFLQVNIIWAVLFIGLTTFVLSGIGVRVGAVFGARFRGKAELAGGVILILMGTKILLEHLGILG